MGSAVFFQTADKHIQIHPHVARVRPACACRSLLVIQNGSNGTLVLLIGTLTHTRELGILEGNHDSLESGLKGMKDLRILNQNHWRAKPGKKRELGCVLQPNGQPVTAAPGFEAVLLLLL
jgi:hypothetical protein